MNRSFSRFDYEHLRNEAHVQLHESITAVLNRHNPEALGIAALHAQYLPLLAKEKEALDAVTKSGISDKLLELDLQRDQLFRGFADTVRAAANHYDPNMHEAARQLAIVLNRYGNIASRPLDEETAALDDLVRELNAEASLRHVKTLALEGWVSSMADANKRFADQLMARYVETAARPVSNMRPARVAVDKVFRAMLDMVEALMTVNGEAAYTAFVSELNAVLERYENILAQEKGMREAAKKAEEEAAKKG